MNGETNAEISYDKDPSKPYESKGLFGNVVVITKATGARISWAEGLSS